MMKRLNLFLLCCWLLTCASLARADTPIVLYKSYAGNLNFVGAQKTMRLASNTSNACSVAASTTAITASIAGIPAAATVISAQLYWAGSSSTPDYTVTFEGVTVTAPTNRQFTSATVGYNYFSGAADVTAQVAAKRNGSYSFSGLTITNGTPYCAVEGVVGGFSLLVIYTVPTETFRVLNLYEGFQYIRTYGTDDISVNLNLSNFKIPNPLNGATGRIAHVTWEGDSSLSGGGERLLFNNYEMTDSANTSGNQFNSNSNISGTADATSYGIDFDAFVLTSPRIAAGQTTATMVYESGQDMVLLNAEIVAVPNVPVSDLSVGLAMGGTPTRGSTITLTHTVTNLGPMPTPAATSTAPTPVTVRHVLPTGMSFVSASGSGWSCSASGQTVTCTSTASIAVGASAPALVITAQIAVNAPASMTTTGSVSSVMFDNNTPNDSASQTITFSTGRYVFTDAECTSGVAFGTGQPCKIVSLPSQIAAQNVGLYITALDLTGRPAAPSQTSASLYLALVCHNPVANAGKQATVVIGSTTTTLNLCVVHGSNPTAAQWKNLNVPFASGKASTFLNFNYPDVGSIELLLSDSTSSLLTSTSGSFVMRPYKFVLSTGAVANPANVPTVKYSIDKFARAGAKFSLLVTAQNYKGELTPNYGKETTPQSVALLASAAPDGDLTTGATFEDMDVENEADFPQIGGGFGAFNGGGATGNEFYWDNVGIITVVPFVADYLQAGKVVGTSLNLGRFYANHFKTEVPIVIVCAPPHPLACSGTGMHYSKQPIGTTISGFSANDIALTFYQGKFARETTLSAFTTKGGTTVSPAGDFSPATVAKETYVKGVAKGAAPFVFKEGTTPWMLPADIFVRASDGEASSLRAPLASEEGQTRVVRGRFLVENTYGSELLQLPVTLRAQYWTGTNGRWADSFTDSVSAAPATPLVHGYDSKLMTLVYTNCKGVACASLETAPATLKTASMAAGLLKFRLAAPKVVSSYDLNVLLGPPWLPGKPARMTFGVNKSTPVIYIREIF